MINGLDHANYNQLSGLYDIRATTISTDDISYDEISTLNNIDTSKTIQSQINSLQNIISGVSLTISGNTLSGVVLLPYLKEYYDDKTEVTEKVGNSYNTIMDNLTNYYTQSSINSITTSLSGRIDGISGSLVTISSYVNTISSYVNTISSNVNTISSYVNTISSYVNTISSNVNTISSNVNTISSNVNTISSNVNTISSNVNTISSNVNTISSNVNTISSNVNTISSNVNTISSYVNTISSYVNTSSNNIITLSSNIVSISSLIYYTISARIKAVSDQASAAQTTANTAEDDGSYSRKQIDTQGTIVFDFFGIQSWNPPPSGLNQRIMDAAQKGIDAAKTASDAASSASSNSTAITAIAIVLGFTNIGLLITAAAGGAAYTSLGAVVTGLSTTVTAHSLNLTTLNSKTQYISTDSDLSSNNYTVITSDIKISQPLTSSIPNIFLSSNINGNSFFCNTVRFYKDITIDGIIYNNNLSDYLTSVSGKIKNVNTISGNTVINSTLYIQDTNNNSISKLANDYSQLTYIGTNTTISGNLQINGGIINTQLSSNINTISSNIGTISGLVNSISGTIYNNSLNNGITVNRNVQTGAYDITIGTIFSNVFINGNLYYNGGLLYRPQNVRQNAIDFNEYINQL